MSTKLGVFYTRRRSALYLSIFWCMLFSYNYCVVSFNCDEDLYNQEQIQGDLGAQAPLTTKNDAPAPEFYKIETPQWQF